MGKVDSLSISGCECFFNTSDHLPPHFHVKSKDGMWEIRAFINGTTKEQLVYEFKFPSHRKVPIFRKLEKEIRKKIVQNRINLLKEWENKVR